MTNIWTRMGIALLAVLTPVAAAAAPILFSVRSNGDGHLYAIDGATALATDLGAVGFADAEGLAFAGPRLYAVGGSNTSVWDLTSAAGFVVGDTGPRAGQDAGLDYNSTNGLMYNIQGAGDGTSLYTIDLNTGHASLVGSSPIFADALAIDNAGVAYAVDGIFTDALYRVNLSTAELTLIGTLGLGDIASQFGLTFADGTLYAIRSSGDLYTVNTATGAATLVGNTVCGGVPCNGWEGLAAPITQAPEPAMLLLLGVALAARGIHRRMP
jgi:hypothetical protein